MGMAGDRTLEDPCVTRGGGDSPELVGGESSDEDVYEFSVMTAAALVEADFFEGEAMPFIAACGDVAVMATAEAADVQALSLRLSGEEEVGRWWLSRWKRTDQMHSGSCARQAGKAAPGASGRSPVGLVA